jgi:hypothetical protein
MWGASDFENEWIVNQESRRMFGDLQEAQIVEEGNHLTDSFHTGIHPSAPMFELQDLI